MMVKYVVTTKCRLASGALTLTDAQAKPRVHNLKQLGKNKYEIVNPVEFKAGEEIGYEGELPKALAANLTAKAEADKAAKKAADAQAKQAAEQKAAEEAEAQRLAAEQYKQMEADALAAWEENEALRKEYKGDRAAYLSNVLSAG